MIRQFLSHFQTETPEGRVKAGAAGAGVGIAVNLLLASGKFAIGLLSGSVAITADATNNFGDALSSVMSFVTIRMAGKHADREHPFGHGRMKYIGALCVGILILLMSVELLKSAVGNILHPSLPDFSLLSLVLMVLAIAAKFLLFRFYSTVGRAIDSSPLLAAAKDSLGDMTATSAVLLSMLLAHFFSLSTDGWMGLVVACLVFKAGFDVCKDTLDSLLGGNTNPALGTQIVQILEKYDDVLGTHDLMIHDYGPGRCVASIHAEVPADGDIVVLHEMIDRAEQEIGQTLHIPICIHMDPVVTGDPQTDTMRDTLSAYLQEHFSGITLHDLRRVPGQERVNIVFDVAVPADFAQHDLLHAELEAQARKVDPHAHCVIQFDVDLYHQNRTAN